MGAFEARALTWQGKEYRIPGNRMMRAIQRVEQHITRGRLIAGLSALDPPRYDLALAWAGVLRYAGAVLTDDEAYAALCAKGEASEDPLDIPYIRASMDVLGILLLPSEMAEFLSKLEAGMAADKDEDEEIEPAAGKQLPAATQALSQKPTSSLSANGASAPENSGN